MECPRCKQETVISLSSKFVSGCVLLCTKCKSVSPHAETTVKAAAEWKDSIKKI